MARLIIQRIGYRSIPTCCRILVRDFQSLWGALLALWCTLIPTVTMIILTQFFVSGGMCSFGLTPISWSSKRQGAIDMYSYSAEFRTGRVATEKAIDIQYMLRYLVVHVKGPTSLCGENLGMIVSYTNLYSELKKKHVAIFYHKLR